MMRLAVTVGLCFLALVAFGVYQGVSMTRARESELRSLNHQIATEQTRIKVLRADWALLTKPERLQSLVQRHLAMLAPVAAAQFTQMASLPMRGQAHPQAVVHIEDLPKRVSGSRDVIPAAGH